MPADQPDSRTVGSSGEDSVRRSRLIELTFTVISMLAGVSVSFGVLSLVRHTARTPADIYLDEATRITKMNDERFSEIKSLVKELNEVHQLIETASREHPATLQIAKVAADVDVLKSQMKELDDAIGQNPSKALAVPLLQKDVDDFKDTYRRDIDTTQGEINRVYDQNKWFIGLMFTLALGVIGLAVTNLVQVFKR